MLSSQTKDEVTHAAVAKIRAAAGGVITLDAMLAMDTQTLQGAINKVGFWPKKTTCVQAPPPVHMIEHDQTPRDHNLKLTSSGSGPFMATQIHHGGDEKITRRLRQ